MEIEDFDENVLAIIMTINEEDHSFDLKVGHSLSDDLDEEDRYFYLDVLNGLMISMREGIDKLAFDGMMARHMSRMIEKSMPENADPEEVLKDILGDTENVVAFKRKLH